MEITAKDDLLHVPARHRCSRNSHFYTSICGWMVVVTFSLCYPLSQHVLLGTRGVSTTMASPCPVWFPCAMKAATRGSGRQCHHSGFESNRSQRRVRCTFKTRGTMVRAKTKEATKSSYDAGQITVLEGLEPVRKRPGMYIGSTGPRGLHHLVYEIVDNSVDEAMAGYCTNILVELLEDDGVRVTDNGRGIPCDVHARTGKSALETVLTVLHAGGKFGGQASGYKVSGGLHGVGISVVNALSTNLIAEVWRNGSHHRMEFSRGHTSLPLVSEPTTEPLVTPIVARARERQPEEEELAQAKKSKQSHGRVAEAELDINGYSGTSVTFYPDPEIFTGGTEYSFDSLQGRLDELAYLNPGLRLELVDRRKQQTLSSSSSPELRSQVFEHKGGIKEMVRDFCSSRDPIHADLAQLGFSGIRDGVEVDIALQWSLEQYSDTIVSFANGIKTGDGGSHVEGFTRAVARIVNNAAKKSGKRKSEAPNIAGEYIREGLTAVISVKVPEPQFEGQTKNRLGNPEVRGVVDSVIADQLMEMLLQRPRALAVLVDKASSAQAAAQAARAARDLVRKKTRLSNTVLPGKLADCSERNPLKREIFIVEGDSAAGSAKQGRDRRKQAILPLRGKILNVEKASPEQLYTNSELQALITALGLGIRGDQNFDISKLRFFFVPISFVPIRCSSSLTFVLRFLCTLKLLADGDFGGFFPCSYNRACALVYSDLCVCVIVRYGRIIIMTDADVDGAHIRMLLLTFLYRYHREIVAEGMVYIACPPLYKIGDGAKAVYTWDEEGLEKAREAAKGRKSSKAMEVQRFKGLGEMMPAQLWETTMDPTKRRLQKVTVKDLAEADRVFSLLMGDKVAPRKEFIMKNSKDISIQDLQL